MAVNKAVVSLFPIEKSSLDGPAHFPMLIVTTLPSLQRVISLNSQADVLCGYCTSCPRAIGNGWTWADQTATVQGRRVSIGEVCAAFASYLNVNAFPPGQVSDLDTAIIAACDETIANSSLRNFM